MQYEVPPMWDEDEFTVPPPPQPLTPAAKAALHAVSVAHLLFWVYMLLSPFLMQPAVWRFNVRFLVPALYLMHATPWHPITWLKRRLSGEQDRVREQVQQRYESLPGVHHFMTLRERLQEISVFSPFTVQGIMLWTALWSAGLLLWRTT